MHAQLKYNEILSNLEGYFSKVKFNTTSALKRNPSQAEQFEIINHTSSFSEIIFRIRPATAADKGAKYSRGRELVTTLDCL